jgi:hypothetical protein
MLDKVEGVVSKFKSFGVKHVLGLLALLVLWNSYGYNQGGVNTRLQIPVIGHSWIKEEGYYFKPPFISRTREFNKNGTIAATDNEALMNAASIVVPPMVAPFADSFQMRFEWSARYELPVDDDGLENVYQKLKSQEALLGNTIMPFSQTLFTNSVNQMIGENFAQGGKSTLLTLIDNQMQYGMYQTKVEKVPVIRRAGNGSNDMLGGTQTDLEVTKVLYLEDKNGQKLRTPLSIAQYGIKLVPNSFQIVENEATGRLVTFIDKKQANLELQIEQDEKQKLLTKTAKTSQLKGENDLVVRTNELNIKKQEAIIAMERQVEEAKLQAEKEIVERQKVANLAVIDKNRELQVAQANEGIQKANAVASKYEAQAVKEVGFAQAAVKEADYKAIDKTILALEVDKAKALAMYSSNMTVNMPTIVGGGENNTGSLETMTSLKVLELLGKGVVTK